MYKKLKLDIITNIYIIYNLSLWHLFEGQKYQPLFCFIRLWTLESFAHHWSDHLFPLSLVIMDSPGKIKQQLVWYAFFAHGLYILLDPVIQIVNSERIPYVIIS